MPTCYTIHRQPVGCCGENNNNLLYNAGIHIHTGTYVLYYPTRRIIRRKRTAHASWPPTTTSNWLWAFTDVRIILEKKKKVMIIFFSPSPRTRLGVLYYTMCGVCVYVLNAIRCYNKVMSRNSAAAAAAWRRVRVRMRGEGEGQCG